MIKSTLPFELQELGKEEETSWSQKFTCLWLKEGDKGMKFFPRMIDAHKRNNHINKLMVRVEIIEDEEHRKHNSYLLPGCYTQK